MNRQTPEFDQRIADWLEVDPLLAPPDVLATVLAALPSIPQARRGLLAPWRFTQMTNSMRAAAGIAIVAIVGVGVLAYNSLPPGGGTESPAPTASPTAAPTVATTDAPSSSQVSFTSPIYGYTISRPADWVVAPATVPWPEGVPSGNGPARDGFEAPVSQNPDFDGVLVMAQPVPDGMTPAAWLLRHAQQQADSSRDCKGPVEDWVDETVGELAVRRLDLECPGGLRLSDVAFVVDGTGYVMSGNRPVIALFLDTFEPGT